MTDVDKYIFSFPAETQEILNEIRSLILKIAPEVNESMAYGMPAYKLYSKPLVYFAGYKSHIGFYTTPTGHEEFKGELSHYKQGKGSVQFPLNKPIPYDLIQRIVTFRVKENSQKSKLKKA